LIEIFPNTHRLIDKLDGYGVIKTKLIEIDLIPFRGDAGCFATGFMRDDKRPYPKPGADGTAFFCPILCF
jgi:hypothetical protein